MKLPDPDSAIPVVNGRRFATWMEDDGVVRLQFTDSAPFEGSDADELLNALATVSNQTRAPLFADITQLNQASREARTIMSSARAGELILAAAVVVSNPVNRMIGQFFIRLNRPPFDLKLFDDHDRALSWVLRHYAEHRR